MKITLEQYLKKLAKFADNDYGAMVRNQFADIKGAGELAMLAAPTSGELEQLQKAVAIMTSDEKKKAENLSDEQVKNIADEVGIDPAVFAIFMNGYALNCKRVS